MVLPSNLPVEKKFRRLLCAAEKLSEEKSMNDWKLQQFVEALTTMLNDVHKWTSLPTLKQVDEYKQRIEKLRQTVDPVKLENQTFPQGIHQTTPVDVHADEQQQTEMPASSPPASSASGKTHTTAKKSDRPNLNRQQQHIQSEEDRQDDIATSMRQTTRSLLHTAERVNAIVKDDQKKNTEVENLIDTNTAKLNAQSKRLKHNAYNVSNCWIYLMLIVVIVTFIYLTLFMRMFRKRTTTVVYSSKDSKSSLPSTSINQTAIGEGNITTTKSTDYISLLLNYANDNHTDL